MSRVIINMTLMLVCGRRIFIFLAITFFLTFSSNDAIAQSSRSAHNSIYVELLGNSYYYSLNYDRMITEYLSLRIGIMAISHDVMKINKSISGEVWDEMYHYPLMINYLSPGNHKFELGIGVQFFKHIVDEDWYEHLLRYSYGPLDQPQQVFSFYSTATIGYRYQPKDGGLIFRIGFTPIFGEDIGFKPWGGLSLGICF